MKDLNFAIVGCGGVGRKRARTLQNAKTVWLFDTTELTVLAAADQLRQPNVSWNRYFTDSSINAVIVSTTHDALADIACEAIEAGKHVLVEKPAGCHIGDITRIVQAANKHPELKVRIGFNHRYHSSILKAVELADHLGQPMLVRGRYGHGGRIGYDKEWRSQPLKGGGELLDQGVHLIDLASLFLGKFVKAEGIAKTLFWNQLVDDNAFMLLETAEGQIAHLHVSSTEWKNTFSLEIYGTKGKLHAEGLGGSYGTERLTWYKMLPEMGPPETTIWEYPGPDLSWQREMDEFVKDILEDRQPNVGLEQAGQALAVVDAIKAASSISWTVELGSIK